MTNKVKTTLLILIILLINSSKADIKSSKYFLGGQFDLSTQTYSKLDFIFSDISMNPDFGYFINSKTAIGITSSFIFSSYYSSDLDQYQDYYYIGVGPSIRYYMLSNTFNPYVSLSIVPYFDEHNNSTGLFFNRYVLNMCFGIDYFLNRIAIEPELYFKYDTIDEHINDLYRLHFGVSIGLRAFWGSFN